MKPSQRHTGAGLPSELAAAAAQIHRREERLLDRVETTASHYDRVHELAARVESVAGAPEEVSGAAEQRRAAALALLQAARAYRAGGPERQQAADDLSQRLANIQVEFGTLTERAQAAARRQHRVTRHVNATLGRLGVDGLPEPRPTSSSTDLAALRAVPERIEREAAAAQEALTTFAETSRTSVDDHLADLVASRVQSLVQEAETLLGATRACLDTLEHRLAHPTTPPAPQHAELSAEVQAQQAQTETLDRDLRSERDAHTAMLKEVEEQMHARFGAWFEDSFAAHHRTLAALSDGDEGAAETPPPTQPQQPAGRASTAGRPAAAPPRSTRRAPKVLLVAAALLVVIVAGRWLGFASADSSSAPEAPAAAGWTWIIESADDVEGARRACRTQAVSEVSCTVYETRDDGRVRYRAGLGLFRDRAQAERVRETLPAPLPADAWLLNIVPTAQGADAQSSGA